MADYQKKSKYTLAEIDEYLGRALPGGAIDIALSKKVNPWINDNGYFGNPVNQRGKASYTGDGYTIDRWIQKNASGVVQVTNNGIVLSGSECLLHQIIEFSQDLVEATVTFSILTADNHLYTCTGTVTDDAATNFAVEFLDSNYSNIAVISDSDKRVIAQILEIGGSTYTIKAAKLELGDHQTLAHQDADGNWVLNEIPDYGEQLRRCQRYQFVPDTGDPAFKSYQFTYVAGASGSVNGNLVGSIPFPVTMRTAPSVAIAGKQVRDNSTGSVMTISSLSVAFTTKDALTYLFGVAAEDSTFIEGHQYALTDQLIFDANL